jgi:ribosomal-protein-alanine N-acetyltransferase
MTEIDPGWRPPTLTTERLVLRALLPNDAADLYRHASNPNVTRYTTWDAHTSIAQSESFISEYAKGQYLQAIPEPIAMTLRAPPGELIGVIGCTWARREHFCMELGYWVGEPHWGRGYAAEAAKALVTSVFATYTVERVQAHCIAENVSSARVLEKIGMKYEGTARSAIYLRGRFHDIRWFAITRGEL